MPIQSVLSSPSTMRLGPPGGPSLIEVGLGELEVEATTELFVRSSCVRKPPKYPSGMSRWPTTYIVVLLTSALLAPPGTGMVVMGTVLGFAQGAALHGSNPDVWPSGKIMGDTGRTETDEAFPPHSAPQLST